MPELTPYSFESQNFSDTDQLGKAIGASLEAGTVLGLDGTLGAGKTRLTQAIGAGLGIADGNVVSPTFTIMVPHSGRLELAHLDAYRIASPEEVDELDLDEMVVDGTVLVVEWADRIAQLLPPIDIRVQIEHVGDQARRFLLSPCSEMGQRLVAQVKSSVSS